MALGVEGLRVGMYTDPAGHTGCTVLLPPPGTVGGMAVRGGAPGTRESAVLGPAAANPFCHAVVLTGCSLFGLRVADGVVDWLEAQGVGLRLPAGVFPIVGAAVVLDIRRPGMRRLDAGAGRVACEAASRADPAQGSIGVGAGCTVGKEAGMHWGSKGGQGTAVCRSGDVSVAALMAVNAFGSVLDEYGGVLAGCRAPAAAPRYPHVALEQLRDPQAAGDSAGDWSSLAHTVIGCVVSNARLDKAQACRVADLAHTGIARSVTPAHTNLDGDALFMLACGDVRTRVDLVADLAAEAVAAAIRSAVRHAEGMPGWPRDPRLDRSAAP